MSDIADATVVDLSDLTRGHVTRRTKVSFGNDDFHAPRFSK